MKSMFHKPKTYTHMLVFLFMMLLLILSIVFISNRKIRDLEEDVPDIGECMREASDVLYMI